MSTPDASTDRTLPRVLGLCLLAFLVMFSYAIARPSAESLFLENNDAADLPLVWILVAAGALITVAIYNRFSLRFDLVTLYGQVCAITSALLVGLILAWKADLPHVGWALYVWKDLYIIVLVEIFYSFANAVFPIQRARWFYGLFGVFGGLGGVVGNLAVGPVAARIGTVDALWLVLPALVLSWALCLLFARLFGARAPMREVADREPGGWADGLRVVRSSSYLLLMLGMIAVVQVAITLIDYQYNSLLEVTYADTDVRTGISGRVYAAVNFGTMICHASVGPILRVLAIPRTLLGVPLLLCVAVVGFAVNPAFGTIAVAKVASKVLDYTIFRAAKEMLYIPLSYVEKTRGKAVVDMLTYRVAKGGASLLLLGLAAVATQGLITGMILGMIAIWLALTAAIVARFRKRVSREEEIAGGGT